MGGIEFLGGDLDIQENNPYAYAISMMIQRYITPATRAYDKVKSTSSSTNYPSAYVIK